jgi:hypothetical protein
MCIFFIRKCCVDGYKNTKCEQHFSYFDPDYLAFGLTVTGLSRVYYIIVSVVVIAVVVVTVVIITVGVLQDSPNLFSMIDYILKELDGPEEQYNNLCIRNTCNYCKTYFLLKHIKYTGELLQKFHGDNY